MFHHPELDRHRAIEVLQEWEHDLEHQNDIAPKRPMMGATPPGGITHGERDLGQMLIDWDFIGFESNKEIWVEQLSAPSKPDFVYKDETVGIKIAIFLDGGIHNKASIQQKDRIVTLALETSGWKVIRIRNEELEDPQLQELYRLSIAKALNLDC